MAYSSCAAAVAANIAIDCDSPIVSGYTGRGVLVQIADAPTIVKDATNPRKVKSITLASGKKFIAIDNVFAAPFEGSNKSSNGDSGRIAYNKTFVVRIPARGADVSKQIVEPMVNSPLGFIAILEKKDKVLDGGFEVIGLQNGLKVNADGVSQDEAANGGDAVLTLSTSENFFECTFIGSGTDYTTALEDFEDMLSGSF